MMKLESDYQRSLIKKLEANYPGCLILKNDANYKQGIPDLTVLYGDKWAMLEVKRDAAALKQSLKKNPNQKIRVDKFNEMSFASFIYPENEEEVFDALERTFKPEGQALNI